MANDRDEPDARRDEFYNSRSNALPEPDVCELDDDEDEPVQKVSSLPKGAKRDSYFKHRDYE
ncbi:MAG TPA: hypothetical protein VGA33_07615 [Thermoanaerobaculia bacterium]